MDVAFGSSEEFDSKKPRIIPAKNTEKGIKQCRSFVKLLPGHLKRWQLYFTEAGGLTLSTGKYNKYMGLFSLEVENLSFHNYILRSTNQSFTNNLTEKRQGKPIDYHLSRDDIEKIATGLLTDYIDYSRRVRGEEIASRSLLGNLKDRFKPD